MSRTTNRRLPGLAAAVLLGGLVLPTIASSQQAGDPPAASAIPQSWYTQALARGRAGINVSYFWSKGSKFRAEKARPPSCLGPRLPRALCAAWAALAARSGFRFGVQCFR